GGSGNWENISVEIPGVGRISSLEMFVTASDTEESLVSIHLTRQSDGRVLEAFVFDDIDFNLDEKLTSGDLSPITFEICDQEDESGLCLSTGELTLHVNWQGTGDIVKGFTKSH